MEGNPFLHPRANFFGPGDGGSQEQLDARIELATEKDWEEVKRIRLESISGEDAEKMGRDFAKDMQRTDEEWKALLKDPEILIFLARVGNEVVGMGSAARVDSIKQ